MKSIVPSKRFISACASACILGALSMHSAPARATEGERLCSPATQGAMEVEFINNSSQTVSFHWMEGNCSEGGGPVLGAGKREKGITYPGHIFRARGENRQVVKTFTASAANPAFVVDESDLQSSIHSDLYTESTCSVTESPTRFNVEFINHVGEPITMQWVGYDCKIKKLREIPANGRTKESTFAGHVFRFVDSTGRQLRALDVSADELTYHISDD